MVQIRIICLALKKFRLLLTLLMSGVILAACTSSSAEGSDNLNAENEKITIASDFVQDVIASGFGLVEKNGSKAVNFNLYYSKQLSAKFIEQINYEHSSDIYGDGAPQIFFGANDIKIMSQESASVTACDRGNDEFINGKTGQVIAGPNGSRPDESFKIKASLKKISDWWKIVAIYGWAEKC